MESTDWQKSLKVDFSEEGASFSSRDFTYSLDAIKVKNIVILPDEYSGEIFREKIFPHCPDLFFLSCRGDCPQDSQLRNMLIEQLATRHDLAVVLFTLEATAYFKIASQRIFAMDNLLIQSYPGWNSYEIWASEMDEFQIIKIMRCFFQQWELMARPGNFSNYYREFQGVNQQGLAWRLDLIAAQPPAAQRGHDEHK